MSFFRFWYSSLSNVINWISSNKVAILRVLVIQSCKTLNSQVYFFLENSNIWWKTETVTCNNCLAISIFLHSRTFCCVKLLSLRHLSTSSVPKKSNLVNVFFSVFSCIGTPIGRKIQEPLLFGNSHLGKVQVFCQDSKHIFDQSFHWPMNISQRCCTCCFLICAMEVLMERRWK